MRYRIAKLNELEELANLHAQSWRNSYRGIFIDEFLDNDVWADREKYWRNRLTSPKNNQRIIVAFDNNKLSGFICAFGNEDPKWGTFIENLHVSKNFKAKGIGKHLISLVAQWANKSFEHKGIYLEVLEDNVSARNFYHSLGAEHQETSLWQPPGSIEKVKDLLYVWEDLQPLLKISH